MQASFADWGLAASPRRGTSMRSSPSKPDCVVAVQDGANVDDDVCRFLESGINIATSRVDYLAPAYMDPAVRDRTEAACRKGGASIYASGSSPGFSSEAMPLVMASMSRRMDRMIIDEFADFTASVPDSQILGIGFGREAGGEFDPGMLHHIAHGFYQSVHIIATALGLALDDISAKAETANARNSVILPGGTRIEQGKVAAQRIVVTGTRDGEPLILFRINWYITTEIDADWDLRENGWRMVIEGDTPIAVDISFPVSDEKRSAAMAGLTAYRVVNAIPFICAAEPGIRTTIELPNIVPRMA